MMIRSAAVAIVLFASSAFAADTIKSGPQVGEKVPGPFHPLNINGEMAGKKHCLFCENGQNPVAMIFARDVDENVIALIKKIEAATAANSSAMMGSFVVFLSDNKDLEGKLKQVAEKTGLKKCVLSIDNPAGPKGYEIAEKADVTVVLYVERGVKANHSFAKGGLTPKAIDAIVEDVKKITK
ncbi:MAG: hypothetical protein K8T89_19340 [Planctomycetes bacterium]|nr:hypothetical protein [Planctomycetota bacterium]